MDNVVTTVVIPSMTAQSETVKQTSGANVTEAYSSFGLIILVACVSFYLLGKLKK